MAIRVLLVMFVLFCGIKGSPTFVSTPLSTTYVQLGSNAIFNWTFIYSKEPDYMKWYNVGENNLQTGNSIMVKLKNNPAEIKNAAYQGRVEYRGNGNILLKNFSLSDEGYLAFSADFAGPSLFNKVFLNVTVFPSIASSLPHEVIAIDGQSSVMRCVIAARPAPRIAWYSNRVPLVSGSRHRIDTSVIGYQNNLTVVQSNLTIQRVVLADRGNISCVAEIPLNSLLSSTNFIVHYPPKNVSFRSNMPGNTALLGETVTLTCNATALPAVYYIIYRNSIPLVNSSSRVLTITSVTTSDEGTYECAAVNYIATTMSLPLNLTVHVPPTLYNHPNETVSVARGAPATLVCTFYGEPVPAVTWHKAGSKGAVAAHSRILMTNSSFSIIESRLSFSAVAQSDHGVYTCRAVNSVASNEVNITLNVTFAPEIVQSTSSLSFVPLGTNFTLLCVVVSNPIAAVQWYTNGTQLHSTGTMFVSTIGVKAANHTRVTSVVEIRSVDKHHFSNYTCIATNFLGAVTAKMAFVVTYKPKLVTSSPSQTFLNATSRAKVSCGFESNPQGSLYWRRKRPIDDSFSTLNSFNQTTLQRSLQLHRYESEVEIQGSIRSHSGVYTCGSSNVLGYAEKNMTVVINFAPQNLSHLLTSYILVNGSGSHELGCLFEGNPGVNISWLVNNSAPVSSLFNVRETLISKDIYHERKRSTLNINEAQEAIQGVYRCMASNHQGSATQFTQLIVRYKPILLAAFPFTIYKQKQDNVTLHCKVRSNPLSKIAWYKDGRLMAPDHRVTIQFDNVSETQYHAITESTLHIIRLGKGDSGNYKCVAVNNIGTAEDTTRLIVQYAPSVRQSFATTENITEFSYYELRCLVEANPMPIITWLHNGKISTGNISNTVIASNDSVSLVESSLIFPNGVKRTDNGTFYCNASNIIGNEAKKVALNVWYGPDFLVSLEGMTNVNTSSNASFKCEAEGHPAPTLSWFKSNVPLQNVTVLYFKISETKTIAKSELSLVNVSKHDTARYSCQASNIVQSKRQNVSLNVLYDPVLPSVSPNVTANFSQMVELNCSVDSNPPVRNYKWTKDGKPLSETGPVYHIGSATELSAGLYLCTPIYASQPTANVSFNLQVQVPARITSMACRQTWKEELNCHCVGYGIPAPDIFWTKNNESTIISSKDTLSVPFLQKDDRSFHCHAKNRLAETVRTYNFVLVGDRYEPWSAWGSCNVSCGSGYQMRTRKCKPNFVDCPAPLSGEQSCNGTCTKAPNTKVTPTPIGRQESQKNSQDETWSIVLYVMIPVLAVLCIILLVWLANSRGCRREEKEFVVPLNSSLSQPPSIRSMPTRRGIYLPDNNFGVLNSGYRPDGKDTLAMKDSEKYSTVEVEMEFGIEGSESTTECASNVLNGNGGKDNPALENTMNSSPENLSFYNSAYTHL